MYYKTKSKTNWPVLITIAVAVFFLIIISVILFVSYSNSKKNEDGTDKKASNAIPTVLLTLNTEEPNQKQVLIKVKVSTIDDAGLEKIVIPGLGEVSIERDKQKVYETTFGADQNATYEIQAYGKNGVFGSGRIKVSNIQKFTSTEPYIPTNFTKVGDGDTSKGLVVVDSRGNEYVWIPVPGGQLTRTRQESDIKYYEDDVEYFQFVNSVAKYQGFYISRYEASVISLNGKEVASSKPSVAPTHRISFNKARKLSNEAAETYKYTGYQTSITSSSAWDTMLAWVEKSNPGYATSLVYGNYSGSLNTTGGTSKDKVNNICDLAGNLSEWTSENYRLSYDERKEMDMEEDADDHRVIRGGSVTDKSTPTRTRRGDPTASYEYIGFRYLVYKD